VDLREIAKGGGREPPTAVSVAPAYFAGIREEAARRWDQLEGDPVLAGPWHQLFRQVQSPRHVLSELLQNADDAGATQASAQVTGDAFVFEHDGGDFEEDHFRSLCRFGYSNKRALHTIGFRGIGFKSTFSLGDQVDLITPSLAVSFHRRRFTEPRWLAEREETDGLTRIRVRIADANRRLEIEKNLLEWKASALSLLFFRNIRRLKIGDSVIHWGSMGAGPVEDSEWMGLHGNERDAYLLIRSEAEPFPPEALEEIRQERMVDSDAEASFPPCRVEIVLGAPGRLFVVLPTGVDTQLPFACNAPFIQDPARMKIKDPETSPTNRWLLERAGRLAGRAMLRWVGHKELAMVERVEAYGLLPGSESRSDVLARACAESVANAMDEVIRGQPILLTENGTQVGSDQAIALPASLFDVWPDPAILSRLDGAGREPLSRHVQTAYRVMLSRRGLVELMDKAKLFEVLQTVRMPQPVSWRQLLALWAFVTPDLVEYRYRQVARAVRVLPAQGKDHLCSAGELVRLGEKKLLNSDEDWEFLSSRLLVLNQNWTRFLAEQRRIADSRDDASPNEGVEASFEFLEETGLDDASDANKVIDRVAAGLFASGSVTLSECVQLAHIAARLGVKAGESFRFATVDRKLHSINDTMLFDENGRLEPLLSPKRRESQLLHGDYSTDFKSCSREEWLHWIATGAAGLHSFIPFRRTSTSLWSKARVETEAAKRGAKSPLEFHYKTRSFALEDWDYDTEDWAWWQSMEGEDPAIWVQIVAQVFAQRPLYWSSAASARLLHVATTGNSRSMTTGPLLPAWALRLRELPCLEDTRGFRRKPGDLLRRTAETEPFLDLEPFVAGVMDREATRPLLDLLGVHGVPANPARILDRLRSLAGLDAPPVSEVDKWYRRLDQLATICSTSDLIALRGAFRAEKLILAQDGSWNSSASVFQQASEDDAPGAALVRPAVVELALWQKIGVAERPDAELALAWLRSLPSGFPVPSTDVRRVRALLARHPLRVWMECGHWLNLASEWVSTSELSLALTMQSLVAWRDLYPSVKQKTADLQNLRAETAEEPPFSTLARLAGRIEERLEQDPSELGTPAITAWTSTLGRELCRVELESEEETGRVRALAARLRDTGWTMASMLRTIPYVDGVPAGTPRTAEVLWLDRQLLVGPLPMARQARRVPEKIAEAFGRPDIRAALDYSFERPADDIRDYIAGNFTLAESPDAPAGEGPPEAGSIKESGSSPQTDDRAIGPLQSASPHDEVNVAGDLVVGPEPVLEDRPMTGTPPLPPPTPRPRAPVGPPKVSLMEQFALSRAFRLEGPDHYRHVDGSSMVRQPGAPFPWERHDRSGVLQRRYLPIDRCLEAEPVELDAAAWGLLESRPEIYALILQQREGPPVELTGQAVLAMHGEGKLTLYPSGYRLIYAGDG
jgi:hypothetical protein